MVQCYPQKRRHWSSGSYPEFQTKCPWQGKHRYFFFKMGFFSSYSPKFRAVVTLNINIAFNEVMFNYALKPLAQVNNKYKSTRPQLSYIYTTALIDKC